MSTDFDKFGIKLHTKLNYGIDRLKSAKAHLEDFKKDTEAAVQTKIKAAKEALEKKKQEAEAAKKRLEEFIEDKKAETPVDFLYLNSLIF